MYRKKKLSSKGLDYYIYLNVPYKPHSLERFGLNNSHCLHLQYCGAEKCRLDKTGHAGILGLAPFLLDVLLLTKAVVELKGFKDE